MSATHSTYGGTPPMRALRLAPIVFTLALFACHRRSDVWTKPATIQLAHNSALRPTTAARKSAGDTAPPPASSGSKASAA